MSHCLKEGKSIIKIRPKSEIGTWGEVFSQEIFVDTLAPVIDFPDISAFVGDSSISISAISIHDDISETTDVSTLNKVIFKAKKDTEQEFIQEYDVSGNVFSPYLNHTFPISPTTDCIISWGIEASDIAGNRTVVNASNIFRGIDGQINIANLFENIAKIDSNIFIAHPGGLGIIYADAIENSNAVISTDFIKDTVISTEQYLQVLSIINTTDIGQSSRVVQLAALKEAGVIKTENI